MATMPATARAFWVVEPGRGEIRAEHLPPRAAGDVVVRTIYTGISRGTESLVFLGHVPRSEHARMRAPFQAGDFPGPVKYGYINVGLVEEGPPGLVGETVFALYPHQTRYVVPADAVHPVPRDVPASRAVLTAHLETALNGLWDARPHLGDRIHVIGAGTVGCLVAWLAGRIPGCAVTLVDVQPSRATVADALGVAFAGPDDVGDDADLVVHASGAPEGLALALGVAADEATVVEMSWYGDRRVPLPLGEAFHARRLRLVSSQVGRVAASQRARWDCRRRLALALSLLADPALDILITGESAFDQLPDIMARLARSPGDALCHRIRYEAT
jgi:threonine dehydrogenase-like Zn-dependent dehydrogenase